MDNHKLIMLVFKKFEFVHHLFSKQVTIIGNDLDPREIKTSINITSAFYFLERLLRNKVKLAIYSRLFSY